MDLVENVKNVWNGEMQKNKIKTYKIGYRISQLYHNGACCYFYFGFKPEQISDESFEIFDKARLKIFEAAHSTGGALSHHHGIGKKMKEHFVKAASDVELKILRAIKRDVDPKNIFAAGNLLDVEEISKAKL